jgi:dihydrodipicolinate reductase
MPDSTAASSDILRDKNVFFALSDEQLEIIAGLCRRAAFATGEILFRILSKRLRQTDQKLL